MDENPLSLRFLKRNTQDSEEMTTEVTEKTEGKERLTLCVLVCSTSRWLVVDYGRGRLFSMRRILKAGDKPPSLEACRTTRRLYGSMAISFVELLDVSIGTQKWGSTHPTEHLPPLCIPIPEEAPISFSEKETVNPYHPDLGIFNRAQPFPPGASAIESVSDSFHLEKREICASIQN